MRRTPRTEINEVNASTIAGTLDAFTSTTVTTDGITLDHLDPLTTLHVRTKNSVYRLTVTSGRAVIVQGGAFFPAPTRVRIGGATLGGTAIKIGWIGVGFCVELWTDDGAVTTTRVRAISVAATPSVSH